jgi:hypothetical protein
MNEDEFFEKARAFFPRPQDWPPPDQRRVINTYEEFLEFSSRKKKPIESLSKKDPKKEPIVEGGGNELARAS